MEAASAAAEAATAAAAAAATSAGFVANGIGVGLRGRGTQAGDAGVKSSDGKDEARTIVLERCAALVKSYGARKQAIAVDSLLERMEQAGVRKNARFLNSVLVSMLCDAESRVVFLILGGGVVLCVSTSPYMRECFNVFIAVSVY